jgi:hypothetical protein
MGIEITMSLNDGLCKREPQESKLGRNIIKNSILLIDEFGFESFTFKKLAVKINSTETSIYRYFDNKHFLLLFLINWYWEWINHLIFHNTINVEEPRDKLRIIIHSFFSAPEDNQDVEYVNKNKLRNILILEGGKVYHTKDVDDENSKGFFSSYKALVSKVSWVISEVNPNFKYPFALATSLFEMSNNNIYFAKHLPRLTDISTKNNEEKEVEEMLNYFIDKLLK